jgi:PPM family protein phosphatase
MLSSCKAPQRGNVIVAPSEVVQPSTMKLRETASPPFSVSVATCTDVGRKRRKNEDKCLVLSLDERKHFDCPMAANLRIGPLGVVLAVADGMGGHQAGEVASALCTEALRAELLRRVSEENPLSSTPQSLLAETVEALNQTVYSTAGRKPELHGMGTTLTAAWLVDSVVQLAQVGDSRAYLFRDSDLILLTQDQTVGNLLRLDGGSVGLSSQIKDMLTQAVGAQPGVSAVLSRTSLRAGDSLMLCCDGLYKVVEEEKVTEILSLPVSALAKVEGLVACANEYGGPDNISVILAEIGS